MKQLINHVDHFVWACRDANLEEYVEKFSALLDVEFDGPFEQTGWCRLYVAWGAGLEILSPLTDDSDIARHIRERGEGPYAMVFGVSDIEAARTRARALGYEPGDVIDADDHPSTARLDRIRESIVGELLGTAIVFGEVIRKDGVATSK